MRLRLGNEDEWLASTPGRQRIRLKFDSPQHIQRIRLGFTETQVSRSQEFREPIFPLKRRERS